eukprot:CAMPEP_0183353530 /NCGR_PEP_ID=MMETSP0164_2-20130417/33482_1 /TAXON_ID=221442 /ORGANISM="Coccolithus pelagicus ssp braarudi, Strain PLY182g" /LENGTH=49 /DNA_ID= /DNA_START= /DNA_END= /DNA_ORIENTATION=
MCSQSRQPKAQKPSLTAHVDREYQLRGWDVNILKSYGALVRLSRHNDTM